MAENITQFAAGKTLLSILQQQGLKPGVVQQITNAVADLLAEAAGRLQELPTNNKPSASAAAATNPQQQAQQAVSTTRDLASADAVLQGVSLIIPRGKFDCGFFSDSLQLTNKQTSAEVPYSSIQHVLIIDAVPKQPNTTFIVLVMESGQPVKQGKNALDLVVLQTKDQPELSIPSPEVCQHLGPVLEGAAAVVLSQLLASYIEGISDDTFLTADSSVFSSSAGDLMVAANKGAQSGWLVPLSAGLCYLGKQGSFMPKASISRLLFHRTGGSSSTFDITIKLQAAAASAAAGGGGGGKGGSRSLELGQIDAAELPKLQAYCMNQRIKMGGDDSDSDSDGEGAAGAAAAGAGAGARAVGAAAAAAGGGADDSDDDEEDEDFDPDAGAQKAAKRRRLDGGGFSGAAAAAGGSDEDDEDDEDVDADEGSEEEEEDLSSDPELVRTDEMSDMDDEDEGLGGWED